MAMNLYACTFKWLISKINQRIQGSQSYSAIGVLDIFGFENFDVSLCFDRKMCLSSVNKLYGCVHRVASILINVKITLHTSYKSPHGQNLSWFCSFKHWTVFKFPLYPWTGFPVHFMAMASRM